MVERGNNAKFISLKELNRSTDPIQFSIILGGLEQNAARSAATEHVAVIGCNF